jgi:hypothetical protein
LLEIALQSQTMGGIVFESVENAAPSAGWLLFAPEDQQLGIGREDLAQSVLKGAASFHTLADVVNPLDRNPLHTTLSLRHESEKPNRMTLARRAMTSGFATAAVSEGERTRQ